MTEKIPYELIRSSAPDSCRKSRRPPGKIRPWQGLLYFGITLAILLLFGGILYRATGSILLETFLQQIFFLVSAVVFARICREELKAVFPVKKLKLSAAGGVLILTFAVFLAAEVYSLMVMYLFPDALKEADDALKELLNISSLPLELFLTCLTPAICEEAMHRGAILHSFRNGFRSKWPPIFMSALLFGIFHIYPVRMFMPAFLGVLMGILLAETGNMLYGCLLHLLYNGILIVSARISGSLLTEEMRETAEIELSGTVTGMAVITCGVMIPFLIWLGFLLVRRVSAPRKDLIMTRSIRLTLLQILLPTLGIVFMGVVVLLSGN